MYKSLILVFAIVCGNAVADSKLEKNAPEFNETSFNINFDGTKPIIFVGKKNLDTSGQGTGSMLYPGDTAGLFLVSILTHAAISSGVEKARLTKEQEQANKVLEPFSKNIEEINPDFLSDLNQIKSDPNLAEKYTFLYKDQRSETSKWELNIAPVFAMTQSQNTLLLYNKMNFIDRSTLTVKKKPTHKTVKKDVVNPNEKIVVVISDPLTDKDAKNHWLNDNGKAFRETIKELYIRSFQLGVSYQFGALAYDSNKQLTVKYLEDGLKKVERGYVISQTCRRTIFASLDGEIKSVPNLDFANCGST